MASELVPSPGARPSKAFGQARYPGPTPVTCATASSAVSSFDHGLLLQSKKLRGELVARVARQGIAGPGTSAYLSWREGSLGAPAIDEGLFAQLPAILGVYERGGGHVAEDRVTASVCGNGNALHERSAAWLRDPGIREVAKPSPSLAPPSSAEAKV